MSKKAIVRRQSIRARRMLMKRWPREYGTLSFAESDGADDYLRGTPILWWRCSYEYDEYDERPAVDELRARVAESRINYDMFARQMYIRDTFGPRERLA